MSAELKVLKWDEKQEVKYCIDNWLRDEQIKVNCAKIPGRIAAHYEKRKEPIALVNFGPTLKETWEEIRSFKHVMSCSGSHKFLIDHGIVPTLHIDVDPRPHKVTLMGTPHKDVEYLIASTCHPLLLDHLSGFNVKLWHIFDSNEEGIRLLPHGEWALTGGCSVGVRTLTMARFLGFTDLHIFGMDGCFKEEGETHAAAHPNSARVYCLTEYDGTTYKTTPSMLEAARNTWHELDMMKDVTFKFYGEGLVQHMARNYKRKEIKGSTFIGFTKPELISAEYLALNMQLHKDNLGYGVGGGKHAPAVLRLAEKLKTTSILDFGCGKGYLAKAIPFPIWEFDPAIPGKQEPPRPADIVCCFDVMEHIEPEKLSAVLAELQRCVRKIGYFIIHTGPAAKVLADGRNAHLLQKNPKWWVKVLKKFFTVRDDAVIFKSPMLHVIVSPKTA